MTAASRQYACAASIGSRLYPRPMPLSRACGAPQPDGRMVRANACCTNIGRLDSPRFLFSVGSQGVKIRDSRFRSGGGTRARTVGASGNLAGRAGTAATVRDDWRAASASPRASRGALADPHAGRVAGISLLLRGARLRHFVGRTGSGREPSARPAAGAFGVHDVPYRGKRRVSHHRSAWIVDKRNNATSRQGAGNSLFGATRIAAGNDSGSAAGVQPSTGFIDSPADHRGRMLPMLVRLNAISESTSPARAESALLL